LAAKAAHDFLQLLTEVLRRRLQVCHWQRVVGAEAFEEVQEFF
jgi:hypothetical protein